MTDKEITALGEMLQVNYSFDPVVIYGTGAIEFKNVMIEFFWNGKIRLKKRIIPSGKVEDLFAAMVEIRLIRHIAEKQLIENFKKQLEFNQNK